MDHLFHEPSLWRCLNKKCFDINDVKGRKSGAGLSEPVNGLEDAACDLSKDSHLVGASASKEEMFLPCGLKCWSAGRHLLVPVLFPMAMV